MMARVQVKCRRCRLLLLSEEAIVNSHGEAVQGSKGDWDCGSQTGPAHCPTHLFVSCDLGPQWVMDAIIQSHYTQGKILCPKCQGRLGSFNFIKTVRQCTCGKTTQPPVHLLCDRVDVLDSNSQHKMAAHAVDCRFGMPVEKTGRNHLSGDETLQELKSSGTFEVDKRCGQEIQGSTRMDETKSFDLQWLFGECFDESSTRQGDDGSAEHCDDDPFTGVVPSLSTAVVNIGENPALKNACRPVSVAEEARSLSTNSSTVQKSDSGDPSTADGIRVSARIHGSSRGERLGVGDDRVCSKGLGRSRYSRKPHEPPHIIQGGGRQRKQFGVSPVDREREKKERQEEQEKSLQCEVVQWEHTCAMCLEVMLNPHSTVPCQHNFCECCLRRLTTINTPTNTKCPLCRQKIVRCLRNADLDKTINKQYPIHIKVRRRQEKRMNQRTKNIPLPGLAFRQRCLSQLSPNWAPIGPASRGRLVSVVFNVCLVVALSYVGMAICRRVLTFVAGVFDGVMERLTGEKLWSEFMGLESRIRMVSCVFVLYLVCACMVKYLRIFREIQR